MIQSELRQKLENMSKKNLESIQKYYRNNPKIQQKCNDISTFVDSLLENKYDTGK